MPWKLCTLVLKEINEKSYSSLDAAVYNKQYSLFLSKYVMLRGRKRLSPLKQNGLKKMVQLHSLNLNFFLKKGKRKEKTSMLTALDS